MTHELTYIPQSLYDAWEVKCSCGWRTNVSGYDYADMRKEAHRRGDAHLKSADAGSKP
jgi:hypothetical protein